MYNIVTLSNSNFADIVQQFILPQVYHDCNQSMKLRHKPFGLNNRTSMRYCAMCYYPMPSTIRFSATNAYIVQPYNVLRLGCNILWFDLYEASLSTILTPVLNLHYSATCHFFHDSNTLKQTCISYARCNIQLLFYCIANIAKVRASQYFNHKAQQTQD